MAELAGARLTVLASSSLGRLPNLGAGHNMHAGVPPERAKNVAKIASARVSVRSQHPHETSLV
jgi:hypothetical protein